jgi:N utilization substance protein A
VLDGLEIGRKEAEDMIMSARVLAGWIKAEDLVEPEAETEEAGEEAKVAAEAGSEA